MADLGAIGYCGGTNGIPAPYIKGGVISGTVLNDAGQPAVRQVYLMNRPTAIETSFAEIQKTESNVNTGFYSFSTTLISQPGAVQEYVVVCFDDSSGTQYNTLIYDKVVPA